MKRIVGISLGSNERDHKALVKIEGEEFSIERIGTDGSFEEARRLFKKLDGKVDAFGLGGIDFTLRIGDYRCRVPVANKLIEGIKTPVFDGNGVKHAIDAHALGYMTENKVISLIHKKVFVVCATNRSGMAQAFEDYGCDMTYGDFMFGLKLPLPIHSVKVGKIIAKFTLPIATRLPYRFLYPIGRSQTKHTPKYHSYFHEADIIAGDFHYIRKYSPDQLKGKVIITTTLTQKDIELMWSRGVSTLVSTTPEIDGRSFGSNIIEAIFYALDKGYKKNILDIIRTTGLKPMIIKL